MPGSRGQNGPAMTSVVEASISKHGWLAVLATACLVLSGCGAARAGGAAEACPDAPAAIRDLSLERYYGDETGSVVDPAKAAEHAARVAPLADYLREVVARADRSVLRSDTAAGACAVAWLGAWARADALLGIVSGPQAEAERRWNLAGYALAYLKLKPTAAPDRRAEIERWLERLADAALPFFADGRRKRNNHWYWLGVGLAGTSLATGSERHWRLARAIAEDAARDIGPDGTLPLELARGQRALHYHAFAVTALVALAELGAARGEDWYDLGGGALHRLVRTTADGLADPSLFDRLAGAPQERPVKTGAGWHALYTDRFPGRLGAPTSAIPTRHRSLGGDVRALGIALMSARL